MEDIKISRRQARKIGARKVLKWTLYVFLLWEAWVLYEEIRGEFSGGILLTIERQVIGPTLIFTLILFFCSDIFGRWAGEWILVEARSPVWTALLFGILNYLVMVGCLLVYTAIAGLVRRDWITPILSKLAFSLAIWAPAGWGIWRVKHEAR